MQQQNKTIDKTYTCEAKFVLRSNNSFKNKIFTYK